MVWRRVHVARPSSSTSGGQSGGGFWAVLVLVVVVAVVVVPLRDFEATELKAEKELQVRQGLPSFPNIKPLLEDGIGRMVVVSLLLLLLVLDGESLELSAMDFSCPFAFEEDQWERNLVVAGANNHFFLA